MANDLVKIADVIVPSVFADYVQWLTTTKNVFLQSGVIILDPYFSQLLAGGGKTFDLPHWNDLANTEANVTTDNEFGTGDAVPEKITTGQEISIRNNRNQVWSASDLVGALAGSDPMAAMANRVSAYWARQYQTYLIKSLQGVIADNIANDSGDMVNDITGGAGAIDATNLFSADAFIDTVQTMGDAGESLVAVGMHSVVYRRAQKNNLIDFIPDARGEVDIPTFLGRRVVVDDGCPVVADGANYEYSSYLFGAGSVGMGFGTPRVPVEVSREALAGTGGGQEYLSSRQEFMLHPRGFKFVVGGIAGVSPTNAELAAAAQWDRVESDRKLIPLAELRTNG